MFRTVCVFAASIAASFAATQGGATVIGGAVTGGASQVQGGIFIELDASESFSVGSNTFQDPNLYAFNEDQNIVIPSEIQVDVGTNPQVGETVASHYVFFDPAPSTTQQGYVDFDADIFGIATSTANLAASDFLLNNNVTYLNPSLRGLEAGDIVSIDPLNPRRLLVDWFASTPGDYVRVFTMESPGAVAVPVPASLPLLLSGACAVALLRRKRN